MIHVLKRIISLYQVALLVHTLLPLFGVAQRPWTMWLCRICAPAVEIGKRVLALITNGKRFAFDFSPLVAIVLLSILNLILSLL